MKDDTDNTDEFTPQERRRIRKVITANERALWLWALIGILAKWIIGVGAAITVLRLGLGDVVKYFK